MKLQDIRIDIAGVTSYENNRIEYMGRTIAFTLLNNLGIYEIPTVRILGIYFCTDKNNSQVLAEHAYEGKKITGYIGGILIFFDHVYFQQCDDENKREYILERIEYAMLRYAEKYGLEKESIIEAAKKIKERHFLTSNSKEYRTRNRKYSARVYLKANFLTRESWLQITSTDNNQHQLLHIATKEFFIGVEHPDMHYSQYPATSVRAKGWINNRQFQMSCGDEQYIFDVTTQEITKTMISLVE